MVRLRNALFYVVLFAAFSLGCTQEKGELTTFDKIIGKWVGVEVYYEEFPPGQPVYTESENISAYNFEFRADGTFVTDSAGFDQETYQWSVTADDNFVWYWDANNADVFDITVLNGSQFHIEEEGEYDNGAGVMIRYREVIRLRK